jgi:hypothetical protein
MSHDSTACVLSLNCDSFALVKTTSAPSPGREKLFPEIAGKVAPITDVISVCLILPPVLG